MVQIGDGDAPANFDMKFTFAVVVRGEINDINELVEFLKQSNLVIAHKELGQKKLWITEETGHDR